MIRTYSSNTQADAIRIEGDLNELCTYLVSENITTAAHPLWKMPGGYRADRLPNAIEFLDTHLGWTEAHVGDYILKTLIGPYYVPGHIFDMFFKPQ